MATLDNKSIRGSVTGAVRYVNNPDKNLPPDGLINAAAYIRGDHAVENLYSLGHNGCSSNPDIAIQQFRVCEQLYQQKKAGAREAGLAEGKKPIVAEHFFMSFPHGEEVSYQTQCEIVDKLCATPLLKDFYAMSNRHWNTDNDHSHILVCNISKDGSKKLGMNNKKRNALRKELDRICALDYGLSVIDDPGLRWKDPEREAFIRQLVEDGKVNVYAPADYEKLLNPECDYDRWMLRQIRDGKVLVAEGVSKNRHCTQEKAYTRWIAEHPNFVRQKDKKAAKRKPYVLISDEQAESQAARAYYFDKHFRSSQYPKYFYAVRAYDEDGNRKPVLLLMIELVLVAMDQEHLLMDFSDVHDMGDKHEKFFASTNWDIQKGYNAMHLQEVYGVRTPEELSGRIQQVGIDLSEVRQGKAYYTRALELNPTLYNAKKVEDLTAKEQQLKQEYRDLKYVEAHTRDMYLEIERSLRSGSLDAMIDYANDRAKASPKELKKFSKNF